MAGDEAEVTLRLTGKLTAKKVAKLLHRGEPGNFHDGNGLRLEIRSANSASWVSRYELNGREHWMGLGPVRAFSLSEARERNRRIRQKLVDGIDPLDERRAERAAKLAAAAKAVTFTEAAESYVAGNASRWRNAKHGSQWSATLRTYVYPILGALPVSAIDVPLILKVLEQHISTEPAGSFWATRTETASRVRGRIEMILDFATARGLRTGDNPAAWKTIGKVLPARGGPKAHHAALPYAELPAFVAELAKRDGIAARALLFTILTAARSGEVRGATSPLRCLARDVMNSRRLMSCPQSEDCTVPHRDRKYRVVHHSTFGGQSQLGHERLGGASCRSSHVRNAPLATVGPKKAACR